MGAAAYLLVLLCGAAAVDLEPPSAFSILANAFSDDGGESRTYVLDVTPDGDKWAAMVQVTRISAVHRDCSRQIVETAAARLRQDALARILSGGVSLCGIDPAELETTLQRYANPSGIVLGHVSYQINAQCGAQRVVLRLPLAQRLDLGRLTRENPAIGRLWSLFQALTDEAFGPDAKPFDRSADPRLQERGERAAKDLASHLTDYRGPVSAKELARDPYVSELRDAKTYRFLRYVAPANPVLQGNAYGPVELPLRVNPKTGEVLDVKGLSGDFRMTPYVVEAAKLWQFAPGSLRRRTVRIAMAFRRYCP